jgi:23S rRNA pseudouridine1911/1915/1917 synthase
MASYSGTVETGGLRLDRYVAEQLKLISRSQIKVRSLEAQINGKPVKRSRVLKIGDRLELAWADPEPSYLLPEDLPLDIVYEDDQVVVINKAQGMVVHPGAGNRQGTLANAILFRLGCAVAGTVRPGIVHRLDKDTSGLIIVAYNDEALAFLSEQFKNRTVRKIYVAIVQGVPKEPAGCIDQRIVRDSRNRKRFTVSQDQGKPALTRYRVIRSWGTHSLLLVRPRTGRTHQIRVHLRHLGNPVAGDAIYGVENCGPRAGSLMLHAKALCLVLPGTVEPRSFSTPLPSRFFEFMGRLSHARIGF